LVFLWSFFFFFWVFIGFLFGVPLYVGVAFGVFVRPLICDIDIIIYNYKLLNSIAMNEDGKIKELE